MSRKTLYLFAIYLAAAALATAQTSAPVRASAQFIESTSPTAAQTAVLAPTDSDVYCAGFFTHQAVPTEITVLGGTDNGLKNEFSDRDLVVLNQGKKRMNVPGGEFMLVRPTRDMDTTDSFPGQRAMVAKMGTLYVEIARIKVQIVNAESSTAEIVHSCEPVLAGDVAVPLTPRPAPPYQPVNFTDRAAPSSGKATGLIAALKEFKSAAGAREIVYLNMGKNQGLAPGNYLRAFRTFQSASQAFIQEGTKQYLTDMMGAPVGRKLTKEEIETLPRTVLGEMMILSVQDDSATGIVTYSWQDIYPGDQVEIE